MLLAILQFDLLVHDAESLKDKRRVVLSVKDRLHQDFACAIAEVGSQDVLNQARLALALVGSDKKHLGQVLDKITSRLRQVPDAELGDCRRDFVTGEDLPEAPDDDAVSKDVDPNSPAAIGLAQEMLADFEQSQIRRPT